MAARKHKDVEFVVSASGAGVADRHFPTFAQASEQAMSLVLSGSNVTFDIIVYSEAGARFVGGSDAVERYREDPDASVFERYQIRGANLQGRVP